MASIFIDILTFSYLAVGIVSLMAYWPTIKDLYEKKPSANITSYFLWTITTGVSTLYSFIMLNDSLVQILTLTNSLTCTLIFLLSVRLNYKLGNNNLYK